MNTSNPTVSPTNTPTITTNTPSYQPSKSTSIPTVYPSESPTFLPTISTKLPSLFPTLKPTLITNYNTSIPSTSPSWKPTLIPTSPSFQPSTRSPTSSAYFQLIQRAEELSYENLYIIIACAAFVALVCTCGGLFSFLFYMKNRESRDAFIVDSKLNMKLNKLNEDLSEYSDCNEEDDVSHLEHINVKGINVNRHANVVEDNVNRENKFLNAFSPAGRSGYRNNVNSYNDEVNMNANAYTYTHGEEKVNQQQHLQYRYQHNNIARNRYDHLGHRAESTIRPVHNDNMSNYDGTQMYYESNPGIGIEVDTAPHASMQSMHTLASKPVTPMKYNNSPLRRAFMQQQAINAFKHNNNNSNPSAAPQQLHYNVDRLNNRPIATDYSTHIASPGPSPGPIAKAPSFRDVSKSLLNARAMNNSQQANAYMHTYE